MKDLSRLLDTVQNIAVAMVRLEERPTEEKSLVETSEPKGLAPPPPSLVA